jgi:hypothetical protein
MIICNNCKKKNTSDSVFCYNCGSKLEIIPNSQNQLNSQYSESNESGNEFSISDGELLFVNSLIIRKFQSAKIFYTRILPLLFLCFIGLYYITQLCLYTYKNFFNHRFFYNNERVFVFTFIICLPIILYYEFKISPYLDPDKVKRVNYSHGNLFFNDFKVELSWINSIVVLNNKQDKVKIIFNPLEQINQQVFEYMRFQKKYLGAYSYIEVNVAHKFKNNTTRLIEELHLQILESKLELNL